MKGFIILRAIKTTLKSGNEKFIFDNKELPIDVLSFWSWSSSELLGNALRGVLAEFIVASTIDQLDKPREEWDSYDLKTNSGLKIEIKSSSYLQSWDQKELSKIIFGIQPTHKDRTNQTEKIRQSDIYIFCVLSHQDKKTVNPLDLTQWDFYILETSILNEKTSTQKTISLSSLLNLNPVKIQYTDLKNTISSFEKKYYN